MPVCRVDVLVRIVDPFGVPSHPTLLTSGWVTLWGEVDILGTVGGGWSSLHAPNPMMPGALSFDN